MRNCRSFPTLCCVNAREFCRSSTVHGLSHLAAPKKSKLERLFWGVTVSIAIGLSIYLIHKSYIRYEKTPVVVAIDKDYFQWNISFPGTTWCFINKLDEEKAVKFIARKWKITFGEKFEYLMDFLRALSNSQYNNFHNLKRFVNDPILRNLDLQDVIRQVNFNYENYNFVTFTSNAFQYKQILTEEGICYSTTFLAPFLSTNVHSSNAVQSTWNKTRQPELCRYFELPCFARLLGIPRPLRYYVHSPYEIPDSRSKFWTVAETLAIDTYFTFLNIEAHPSLNDLRQQQRMCNLRHEIFPFSESPVYSLKLCEMNCRRKLCMRYCKCVPHFYVRRADQPVCDLRGLACLSKYANRIVMLGASNDSEFVGSFRQQHDCDCYPSCSETEYILERSVYVMQRELYMSGMRYSWYLDIYPKISVSRQVIFGFEGLLVNLGGIASFFIGSSIVSAIEVFYFFTLRLFRQVIKGFMLSGQKNNVTEKTVRFSVPESRVFYISPRKLIK